MNVGELIQRLNNGEKIADIAAEFGVTASPLGKKLNGLGYHYNQRTKQRTYIGEGEEPIHINVNELLQNMKPRAKDNSHKGEINVKINTQKHISNMNKEKQNNESSVNELSQEYMKKMYDEMKALRELLTAQKEPPKGAAATQTPQDNLYINVGRLPKGEEVRKTIVIGAETAAKFDEFAAGIRLNKSDLMELAILELIEKYKA